MNDRTIPLTNARGDLLVTPEDAFEPLPGSVVLTEGLHGTAWQRHFSDGLWHSTTGRIGSWRFLLTQHSLIVVHDAEERPAPRRKRPGRTYAIAGRR